jgi:predicted ATPase/DNA-binding SARP family transcriptional activator
MIDKQLNLLKVTALGGFSVEVGGKAINSFVSRKVTALLVYLLFTRRPIPREVLADLLWDKLPPARALANLRTALWDLQQNLGDYLQITNQTVEINSAAVWFDVAQLEQALSTSETYWRRENSLSINEAQKLSQTLALYSGDFLEGFFLRDSEVFETWLSMERERLHKRIVEAVHHLALFSLQNHDYAKGIAYARRLVALDPTWEEAHRTLMQLLAFANQRASALAQFQICKQILAEEFNVAPSQEMVRLYEEIQADKLKPLPVTVHSAHNLPKAPTTFIERPTEIKRITELLDQPDCHLLTLLGPGGMGKSRLALQTAWNRADDYPDGVYFVALAGVSAVETIPSSIVLALRVTLQGQTDFRSQVFDYLHDKRMLMVIDNFEHLLNGALLLSDLLLNAPHLKILVTSRERLNIQEEWLLEIDGMAFPTRLTDAAITPDAINNYGALALFSQTARHVSPEFSLEADPAMLADAVRICQLVEGMPLGIELAAAHLRFMSCHDVAQQIETNLDFLSTNLHNVPERHRSIRLLFMQSVERLSEAEQTAFMKLAVFRSGSDRQAAEGVAGATLPILSTLVEHSLLHFTGDGRYEMHQLVQRYALEQLIAAGQWLATQEAHCAYFVELAEASRTAPLAQKIQRMESDYPNILAALEWAYAQQAIEPLLRLCGALRDYWQIHGTYQESYRWSTQAVALLDSGTIKVAPEIEIGALDTVGIMAWLLGEMGQAEHWLLRSLHLRRASQYTVGMCVILDYLSLTYLNTNQFDLCRPCIKEALDLAHQQGDKAAIGQELLTFGLYATHTTDWDNALDYYQKSIKVFEEQNNQERVQIVLTNMAVVYIKQEKYAEAQHCCEQALAILNNLSISGYAPHGTAVIYGNMGEIAQKRGFLAQARTDYVISLKAMRALGDKMNIAYLLESFGSLEIVEERIATGISFFGAADALREALGAEISPREAKDYAHYMAVAHSKLDAADFDRAWANGSALSMDQAIDLALSGKDQGWS